MLDSFQEFPQVRLPTTAGTVVLTRKREFRQDKGPSCFKAHGIDISDNLADILDDSAKLETKLMVVGMSSKNRIAYTSCDCQEQLIGRNYGSYASSMMITIGLTKTRARHQRRPSFNEF